MHTKLPNKFGPWVTGDEFFNRTAEVERLTQLLDEKNNILLVAPRRIGKTSLVRETFRRMEERGRDYLLFADLQDCKTPEDVIVTLSLAAQPYRKLASKIAERHRLKQPQKALRDVLRVLEHDGYLEMDGESGEWVFVSPLIRDWWKHRFGAGYVSVLAED